MKKNNYILLLLTILSTTGSLLAQTDTTAKTEDVNFDDFGDADAAPSVSFCTQKVLYLSPTKLISVGYELQTPFSLSTGAMASSPTSDVNRFGGLRLAFNTPLISRSNFILNAGVTYWNTSVNMANPERSPLFGSLNNGLRSTGVNFTAFKPLDSKHFLIIQAQADMNGNYRNLSEITNNNTLTLSGAAIYGWKKNDNFMWGLGVTRTYRAGQVIHIPVVLYNRTFNQRYGIEALFPARLNLRRNFSPTSYLLLGYEIEGNAFYLNNAGGTDWFLRRGEMKPRITFEKQLYGFIWLSAQAGWRYNWRFDVFNTQNPTSGQQPLFANTLGNPFYFNVSVNLVSP